MSLGNNDFSQMTQANFYKTIATFLNEKHPDSIKEMMEKNPAIHDAVKMAYYQLKKVNEISAPPTPVKRRRSRVIAKDFKKERLTNPQRVLSKKAEEFIGDKFIVEDVNKLIPEIVEQVKGVVSDAAKSFLDAQIEELEAKMDTKEIPTRPKKSKMTEDSVDGKQEDATLGPRRRSSRYKTVVEFVEEVDAEAIEQVKKVLVDNEKKLFEEAEEIYNSVAPHSKIDCNPCKDSLQPSDEKEVDVQQQGAPEQQTWLDH